MGGKVNGLKTLGMVQPPGWAMQGDDASDGQAMYFIDFKSVFKDSGFLYAAIVARECKKAVFTFVKALKMPLRCKNFLIGQHDL